MSAGKVSTPAGRVLAWLVGLPTLAVLGWLLWSLAGWVGEWRLNRSTGMIVITALGALILVGVPMAGAMVWAALAMALEGMGLVLERPDALSEDEERRAAATKAHCVWYVYGADDEFDNDVAWGVLVAVHPDRSSAEVDCARRSAPPPGKSIGAEGRYVVDDPCNLLALREIGMIEMDAMRGVLVGRPAEVKPEVRYSPGYYRQYLKSAPLSLEECRRANELKVWTIYYEDQFHVGPNRETFPVAVCLTAEEADAEVQRRGPLNPGFDGYLAQGPYALVPKDKRAPDIGADTVREVLRRAGNGERGPVSLG